MGRQLVLHFRPGDPEVVELWESQVRRPCSEALDRYYRVLKDEGHLGHVFRYQSLPELVGGLERRRT